MNKTKIILAATGGVIALAVLVTAYLAWDAFSRRNAALFGDDEADEPVEGLSTVAGKLGRLRAMKPYPSEASCSQLKADARRVEFWRDDVRRLAARGDWGEDESLSPAQFKECVIRDARRLMGRSADAAKPFMKADFGFGPFKPYLADALPPRDQLATLQRQWYDITSLCELLATNCVERISDLRLVERKEEEKAKEDAAAKAKRAKKGRAGAAAKSVALAPSVMTYSISFVATNNFNLASLLRQLGTGDRFTVVDKFAFSHEHDSAAAALGGGGEKKKEASPAATGRRGRRRAAASAAAGAANQPEEKKHQTVFDPEVDARLLVELTVSVYDFRTLDKSGEKGEVAK